MALQNGVANVNAVVCQADVKYNDMEPKHALYKLHVSFWGGGKLRTHVVYRRFSAFIELVTYHLDPNSDLSQRWSRILAASAVTAPGQLSTRTTVMAQRSAMLQSLLDEVLGINAIVVSEGFVRFLGLHVFSPNGEPPQGVKEGFGRSGFSPTASPPDSKRASPPGSPGSPSTTPGSFRSKHNPSPPASPRAPSALSRQASWVIDITQAPSTADASEELLTNAVFCDSDEDGLPHQLFNAATHGNLPLVTALLEQKVDPNAYRSAHGTTPLIAAAGKGHTAIVEVLLEHGAHAGAKNNFGETADTAARNNKHADVLRVLPGGTHKFDNLNVTGAPCMSCGKVVGKGRRGLWCAGCGMCKHCGEAAVCPAHKQKAKPAEGCAPGGGFFSWRERDEGESSWTSNSPFSWRRSGR